MVPYQLSIILLIYLIYKKMKKLLLILLMGVVVISASMAQSIRTGAADIKNATAMKPLYRPVAAGKMKEIKTQMAPYKRAELKQEKVISTVSRGDKKIQLLKNENGTFSKRVVSNKATQKLNRNTASSVNKSTAAAATLFESFEGWDGTTPDWTPNGWSRDNKTDIVTWDMADANFIASPIDGDYMAWVDLGFFFDDDDNMTISDPRDEMLISPTFTPVTGDFLFFDINFAPIWMFLDFNIFDFVFDDPVFNIQLLLSSDNGGNWNVVWDAAKDEGYTEDNIWDYTDNEWFSKKISLASYIGKPIKIAFRYYDRDGGDNIGLDNIAVRELNPDALYMRPQGYFIVGMTPEWMSYDLNLLLGHTDKQSIWRNLSLESDTYSWTFENPDGSGSEIKKTEKNPDVPYPFGFYTIPTLTAKGGSKSSTYQWGSTDNRFFQTGGNMYLGDDIMLGVGNYDLTYDFFVYTDGAGGYTFGTNADNMIDGVANYYEKPVCKYILDGVWTALGRFSFPAGTEFTMVIHRVVDGVLADTIATSTCTTKDVVALASSAFTMPFTTFITIDPETGLEIEHDYLEIEDAILIEITGFNNMPGTAISFCNQEFDVDPTKENNAYIFVIDDDGRFIYAYNGSTSLIMNLEVTYSFLSSDSYTFDAPEGGGSKSFNVVSYFSPDEWWLEKNLPEWISSNIDFDEDTWEITLTLTAKPLPANLNSREAIVKIITYGADMSILVKQDKNTGIPVVAVADTKVTNNNNNFELTYTPDYSVVSVYNVVGQKISDFRLPVSGKFTIPAENYSKGIYLFNFTGSKGASAVRAIKM